MVLKKIKIIQIFSNGVLNFYNNPSLKTLTKYKYYDKNFKDSPALKLNNSYFKPQARSSVQKYRKIFF